MHDTPKLCVKWLPSSELWYNSSYHTSLKCSPFKALYGVEPYMGMLPLLDPYHNSEALDSVQECQNFLHMLKTHLANAQNKMKFYADKNRSFREFQVGDKVFLKLQSYAQALVVHRPCAKLAFKYFGEDRCCCIQTGIAIPCSCPPSFSCFPVEASCSGSCSTVQGDSNGGLWRRCSGYTSEDFGA